MNLRRQLLNYAVAGLILATGVACTPIPPEAAAFRQVGVIEGFYGKPWSHRDRIDMITFMGKHGLTHYYYAPKDDPWHRELWKEPYAGEALERFQELIKVSSESEVQVVFAISPGSSIRYSSDTDFIALTEKLDAMKELGVNHFALLFDDAPSTLADPSDRRRFKSAADGQAFLINRTNAHLIGAGGDLVVCPSTYTDAWGDQGYLQKLGETVANDVPFFWTGSDVVAPGIDSVQATTWSTVTGRLPLIWENYPANDYAPWRLFFGAWKKRDPLLGEVTAGIVSNPMNQAHASMLALLTLAEYARNPDNYDPEVAVQAAAETLYGASAGRELQPFIEIYAPWVWEEQLFDPLFVPQNRIPVAAIEKGLVRLQEALVNLHGLTKPERGNLEKLVEELEPVVAMTAARLKKLKQSSLYVREGDFLSYNAEADVFKADRTNSTVRVDGTLSEWKNAAWRDLTTRQSQSLDSGAEAAFMQDDEHLYIAVLVNDKQLAGDSGLNIGDRDHLTLVLERADGGETDELLVYLVPPDTRVSEPYGGMLDPASFMVKVLGASEDLIFEPFIASLLDPENQMADVQIASRTQSGGYAIEVALPKAGLGNQRLSLVAISGDTGQRRSFALATRNYPVNRATFAEISF
ncbi:MAG TPA: beta-N-acetylglucosaminidase domain-containing protein [Acidobacteriota bacterium]|nr:beta-N-acetylglucosaminidase domain-containing protein [Acidobacteriota bacterium]